MIGWMVKIFGFSGSLRKGSYNKSLLCAAVESLPKDVEIEIFSLEGIPTFNQDLEMDTPERVKEFKAKIQGADAILIATPEYNHSVSGVLKNTLDWASRPYGDNSFNGKPVAIMSASIGDLGGVRAQNHLRDILACLDTHMINKPRVYVAHANEKIDENGMVIDKETRERIRELVLSLVAKVRELSK